MRGGGGKGRQGGHSLEKKKEKGGEEKVHFSNRQTMERKGIRRVTFLRREKRKS